MTSRGSGSRASGTPASLAGPASLPTAPSTLPAAADGLLLLPGGGDARADMLRAASEVAVMPPQTDGGRAVQLYVVCS